MTGGGAAQPRGAGPGGQAGQAQCRDGDPGQEDDPGDRQVRQPAVEDPGVELGAAVEGAVGVGRQDQRPPAGVAEPGLERQEHRQERAERGHRRGEPARPVGPDGEPYGAERGHRRDADGDVPPRWRACDALVGVHREHDAHEDQVGRHRPDRGRGPGDELGRPARPGGRGHQVRQAAAAVPRSHPGGHAGHERPEVEDRVPLAHVPERAQPVQRRRAGARPVGVEPEQRGDQRQDPRHRVAAQFHAQQPRGAERDRAGGARCPVPHRGGGRGGHHAAAVADRAAASTAL